MTRTSTIAAMSALVIVLLAGGAKAMMEEGKADMPGHVMVTPADVQWADAPSIGPGAMIAVLEGTMKDASPFTALIKFPADFKIPVHTHPTTERVTVLSGNLHLGIGDKFEPATAKDLPPGSFAMMSPGVPMFAFTEEETVIELHGTGPWGIDYLNPEDDPARKQ